MVCVVITSFPNPEISLAHVANPLAAKVASQTMFVSKSVTLTSGTPPKCLGAAEPITPFLRSRHDHIVSVLCVFTSITSTLETSPRFIRSFHTSTSICIENSPICQVWSRRSPTLINPSLTAGCPNPANPFTSCVL